ncbi:uncharacterized OsmC-like protein [Bacillus oleivorans]|uniref:Uncharacterized OsmC-like protein n=1 Tax=Bacillus oleivorans TaxID=1448271 RepID=A0A285D5Q5_9BACI|nr:OsmC family protein [Bacillus oleivorans]SNX75140.1 uncharacterized OsmC-like protein [Bacillus oleivorans]
MDFKYENNHLVGITEFSELHASPNSSLGFKPFELMLTSLVTCSGSLLVNLLKKKRIAFRSLYFSAEAERNSEKANRIVSVAITANVEFEKMILDDTLRKIEELIVNNCGMIQTIIGSVDVSFTIRDK